MVSNGEILGGIPGPDAYGGGIEFHSFVRSWRSLASQHVVGVLHPHWPTISREASLGMNGGSLCKTKLEGSHAQPGEATGLSRLG